MRSYFALIENSLNRYLFIDLSSKFNIILYEVIDLIFYLIIKVGYDFAKVVF